MTSLATLLDHQSPFEHNVPGYRQNPLFEHRPHLMQQPVIQRSSPADIGDQLNPESNLGQGDGADAQALQWSSRDEGNDLGLGPWTTQLRDDVRIKQPTRHRLTLRTGNRERLGSSSMSR